MIQIKKVLLIVVPIVILLIASIAIYIAFFTDIPEQRKVKGYVKETYGYDIEIKTLSRAGILSNYEYVVFPKDHEDFEFNVVLDPSTHTITDNHAYAVEADKAYHQLEKVIPAIKKLGFQGPDYFNDEIRVSYSSEKKVRDLSLYSPTPIEMAKFEEKELDRFFELQRLIKESGAEITYVTVSDMRALADSKSVLFYMNDVKNVNTKEGLFVQIKKSTPELASFDESK